MSERPAYPVAPGAKEDTTSLEAALTASKRVLTLRKRVLDAIAALPGTADEIAERLGETVLAIRPRFSELRKMDRIEPTGQRRKNDSGSSAHVWRVKETPIERFDLATTYLKAKGNDQ